MWKESYSIGVQNIDRQHMELFRMVKELVGAIDANADSASFKKAIAFLKEYTVTHFRDEEEYQSSIGYCGIEEHKKLHSEFTDAVLELEQRLESSGYDMRVVKELAGMLTVWLIYHVADADQRITRDLPVFAKGEQRLCIECVASSIMEALEAMAGLSAGAMEQKQVNELQIHGDVMVEVGLRGDLEGRAYFGFSKEFAFKLMEIMLLTRPEELDELVCSALAELSNIASGNAATALTVQGTAMDITTPAVTVNQSRDGVFETVSIDTGAGGMTVSVQLD